MMYQRLAERLAEKFQANPIDYVAEADLQIEMVEILRSELSPSTSSAEDIGLEGTGDSSFKREYWQTVEQKLSETEEIDRVHAEVSIRKGERLDVAVFQPELKEDIQWVSGGSKRFSKKDLGCVYEVKFVKNKTSFPKHTGNPIREVAEIDPSVDKMLQRDNTDDPLLDFGENSIRDDIHELNRFQDVEGLFLLLFSNNNYLYHDPTPTEKDSYMYGELYHRMGEAAVEWMRNEADGGVDILYVHPRGRTWITD